jgi:methionine aminopeptidase
MEVEAEFAHEFIRRGGRFAYNPIIASGLNACALHYTQNDQPCRKGELLLLDVASSYANYNADMTRTIPVSGRFSRRQKQVYKAVLRVLRAVEPRGHAGQIAARLADGSGATGGEGTGGFAVVDTGGNQGQDPDDKALRKYFMHGAGHPLGLDVHDSALTVEPIQAGWVLTVEPAIYIREEGLWHAPGKQHPRARRRQRGLDGENPHRAGRSGAVDAPLTANKIFPQRNAKNAETRTYVDFRLHCTPSESLLSASDFAKAVLNAKTQGPKGAKRSFLLGVFAPWRLCVERSLSVSFEVEFAGRDGRAYALLPMPAGKLIVLHESPVVAAV